MSTQSDFEIAKALQEQFDQEAAGQPPVVAPPPPVGMPVCIPLPFDGGEYTSVINRVVNMAHNREARTLADKYGMAINTVSWEDNARHKNSAWGPCISDMTLQVDGHQLPVIRSPNFQDVTWDVEIDKIPLVVGNEHGEMLRTVTLKEYLSNFTDYLHNSNANPRPPVSLLANRDTHVIMSAQACFLPVPKSDDAKFNVCIYNYQSSQGNPAVLAIVASVQGTSAQVLEGQYGGQKLYHNKNGERCSFVGQRLSDHRIEQGQTANLDAAMNEEEKQQNMLLIIQVPLKVAAPPPRMLFSAVPCAPMAMASAAPMMKMEKSRSMKDDIEDVIVKVGDSEGKFAELNGCKIERDPSFPIRVTLQYYKATSNGVINEQSMKTVTDQIKAARKNAIAIGSLVVGGQTGRVTEHNQHGKAKVVVAPWWEEFWLMHKTLFPPTLTSAVAAEIVFENGRFAQSTLSAVQDLVLDILLNSERAQQKPPQKQPLPAWNVL